MAHTAKGDSIPFPSNLRVFLFPSCQKLRPILYPSPHKVQAIQSYSSSVQIYEQGVQLCQEDGLIPLIGGSIKKTIKEESLIFGPSFPNFWVVLH